MISILALRMKTLEHSESHNDRLKLTPPFQFEIRQFILQRLILEYQIVTVTQWVHRALNMRPDKFARFWICCHAFHNLALHVPHCPLHIPLNWNYTNVTFKKIYQIES